MSSSYPASVVNQWRQMRDKFDQDSSMPNPYEESEDRMFFFSTWLIPVLPSLLDLTIAKLQRELLKEAKQTSNANPLSAGDPQRYGVSSLTFFQKAIELEDRV